MPGSNSFSESVDLLIHLLRPHGRPETSFPAAVDQNATRFEADESIRPWFVRLVNAFCDGKPKDCAIEDNIALFGTLFWQRNTLVGANISTLITSCDLDEYFQELPADCAEVYLRLDLDYGTLGVPFSHPLPHIHVLGDLSPRFTLEGGSSGNVVMDYLEFVYRQYAHEKWQLWAEREWDRWYFLTDRSPEDNPFPLMMRAFNESQIGVLWKHADSLKRLKQILRVRKDELFEYHMNGLDRELLGFPETR